MGLLIFGGAGSLGTELVNYYQYKYKTITVVSRDEAKHWELRSKFPLVRTVICDVRDRLRVEEVLLQVQPTTIIVAHALKQVDICEKFPLESIKTNVLGVENVISAIEAGKRIGSSIETVCFISTDKACNPINVYGMCKSISERIVATAALNSVVRYVICRYGNVISSKGSVIPLFLKQAHDSNCSAFTVTDKRMTRFMMTLTESVELIEKAIELGRSGDIWIPKLDSMCIMDLAEIFSEHFKKDIKTVGMRPGEKIHEVLMNEEEGAQYREELDCFVFNKENSKRSQITEYSSKDFVICREALNMRLKAYIEDGL